MEYVARLLHQEQYRKTVKKIARLEADRIYCRHNMEHFMDVARLAQIRNLKEQLGLDEEMIYLYAALHGFVGVTVKLSHRRKTAFFHF